MQPHLRSAFNAAYLGTRYAGYAEALTVRAGGTIGFRLAETPVFFSAALAERCASAACEIVAQLRRPDVDALLARAVPEAFATGAGTASSPQFVVVDFAIARAADRSLEPRLVELQGFPSLLAFQVIQSDAWLHALADISGFTDGLSPYYGTLDRASFLDLARRAIIGDADPAETILCDVDPRAQKTACDFAATEALFGIVACDPRETYVRRGKLYRRDARGRELRVSRIYNRIVGDDLARPGASPLPFDPRVDVGVTWAPHPRWFWAWSKAALPHLEHPAVPRTRVLSSLETLPDDLGERYVLKPLFSFAGSGVNVQPSAADVAAIPVAEREGWCLQEKIEYAPALRTPGGDGVKIEVRVMLLRPDDREEFVPATNLCRLSRGEMIGVDYNRDRTWVGSSVGLWPATEIGKLRYK